MSKSIHSFFNFCNMIFVFMECLIRCLLSLFLEYLDSLLFSLFEQVSFRMEWGLTQFHKVLVFCIDLFYGIFLNFESKISSISYTF